MQCDNSARRRAHHASCPGTRSRFGISMAARGCWHSHVRKRAGGKDQTNAAPLAGLSYASAVKLCSAPEMRPASLAREFTAVHKNIESKCARTEGKGEARQRETGREGGREEPLSSPEALRDEPGRLLWPPGPLDRPARILP